MVTHRLTITIIVGRSLHRSRSVIEEARGVRLDARRNSPQSLARRVFACSPSDCAKITVLGAMKLLAPISSRRDEVTSSYGLFAVQVMCANHPKVEPGQNCDWIGEYGQYAEHMAVCRNEPCISLLQKPKAGCIKTTNNWNQM